MPPVKRFLADDFFLIKAREKMKTKKVWECREQCLKIDKWGLSIFDFVEVDVKVGKSGK